MTDAPPGLSADAPPGLVERPEKSEKADKAEKKQQGTKRKWARQQQKEVASQKLQRADGSNFYNIWYHKYLGDYVHERIKAINRCHPHIDSGMTKADLVNPENSYFCLHYARGMCTAGRNCSFFHRVPTPADDAKLPLVKDIFGRERHASDRDDMSGVGNFNRPCKVLWVGNAQLGSYKLKAGDAAAEVANPWGESENKFASLSGLSHKFESEGDWLHRCQEVLARHFSLWGVLERIDVKPKFDCAFISYRHRAAAEFAKVAMSEQSLDQGEQLSIRWAREDPNPKGNTELLEYQEQMLQALEKRGHAQAVEQVREALAGGVAEPKIRASDIRRAVAASKAAQAAAARPAYPAPDPSTEQGEAATHDPEAYPVGSYAEYDATQAAEAAGLDPNDPATHAMWGAYLEHYQQYPAGDSGALPYMQYGATVAFPSPPPGLQPSSVGPMVRDVQEELSAEQDQAAAVAHMNALLDSIDAGQSQ